MNIVKILFFGTGNGSHTDIGNYHSNLEITYRGETLTIDCGTDMEHSLQAANRTEHTIQNLFITHIHSDHCGDLERIAFIKYFENHPRMNLFVSTEVYLQLTERFRGALQPSIPEFKTKGFGACFKVQHGTEGFYLGAMRCKFIKTIHVNNGDESKLNSYGLFITAGKIKILFTSDTQFNPSVFESYYKSATVIFHDCATGEKNASHPHISELATLPEEIKEKMFLYHYGPGEKPDPYALGFAGYVMQRAPMYI